MARAADFTIADVLAWARTKPPHLRYDYTDAFHCAIAQFGNATGRYHLVGLGPTALTKAVGRKLENAVNRSETFGALADLLEALLHAEPKTDWAKPETYMPEGIDALVAEFAA